MTDSSTKFVEAGGLKFHVDDRGAGAPVIFSSGFGTCIPVWEPQMAALSDSYRVINWDYRGHGRSDSPEDAASYDMAYVVEDLANVLDAMDIERVVVGGLSVGGSVAMRFALNWPDRVRALILCDTGPGFKNPKGLELWNRQINIMAIRLEEKGIAAYRGKSGPMGGILHLDDDDLMERLAAADSAQNAQGLAHFARGSLNHDQIIDRLPEITAPTLVIVGEEDQAFLRSSEVLEAKIPNATRRVIPNAGHIANLDNAQATTAAIREFLDNLPNE